MCEGLWEEALEDSGRPWRPEPAETDVEASVAAPLSRLTPPCTCSGFLVPKFARRGPGPSSKTSPEEALGESDQQQNGVRYQAYCGCYRTRGCAEAEPARSVWLKDVRDIGTAHHRRWAA